ncbi:MAG: hypothetical protein A2452_07350 [Candidatus Firestonebacteria bacterium RIFOXYC2_FULL_39_67]|nr:MAG: hypothetical protein A2452_07350 [Candidatus Firestonebacteria bacterium RIFOXYC2_FULL_39_67]
MKKETGIHKRNLIVKCVPIKNREVLKLRYKIEDWIVRYYFVCGRIEAEIEQPTFSKFNPSVRYKESTKEKMQLQRNIYRAVQETIDKNEKTFIKKGFIICPICWDESPIKHKNKKKLFCGREHEKMYRDFIRCSKRKSKVR